MGFGNVFDHIDMLKQGDKAFDVGVIVYFGLVDIIIVCISDFVKKHIFGKQTLEIIFSTDGMHGTTDTFPVLKLKNDGISEAAVTVKIDAKRDTVKDLMITIPAISFATIQQPRSANAIEVDGQGNYIINVNKMIGNQEKVVTTQTFKLLLVKEPVSVESMSEIVPELNNYPVLMDILFNKILVQAEA